MQVAQDNIELGLQATLKPLLVRAITRPFQAANTRGSALAAFSLVGFPLASHDADHPPRLWRRPVPPPQLVLKRAFVVEMHWRRLGSRVVVGGVRIGEIKDVFAGD